jgi:hypothetical protein
MSGAILPRLQRIGTIRTSSDYLVGGNRILANRDNSTETAASGNSALSALLQRATLSPMAAEFVLTGIPVLLTIS